MPDKMTDTPDSADNRKIPIAGRSNIRPVQSHSLSKILLILNAGMKEKTEMNVNPRSMLTRTSVAPPIKVSPPRPVVIGPSTILENHQTKYCSASLMQGANDAEFLASLNASQPVLLPTEYHIYDFTRPQMNGWSSELSYSIGKYDEVRPFVYKTELFGDGRDLHMGLDIGGPVHTPVHSCLDGEVYWSGYHDDEGDYGHTVITIHEFADRTLYILYGHLSSRTTELVKPGRKVVAGELIGWFGKDDENGGWPPHLHLQLSWAEPDEGDIPGVVHREEREQALKMYPDPQFLIGKKY